MKWQRNEEHSWGNKWMGEKARWLRIQVTPRKLEKENRQIEGKKTRTILFQDIYKDGIKWWSDRMIEIEESNT